MGHFHSYIKLPKGNWRMVEWLVANHIPKKTELYECDIYSLYDIH
jgi:hypothetical protein